MCQTNQSRKPSSSATSGRPFARQPLQEGALAPVARVGELLAPLLLCRCPRVVGRPRRLDPGIEDDEAQAALGIRRREEHAQAGARGAAPEDRSFGPGGIHHGPDVVHGRLERLHLADAVGQARPALVEHQHATVGREPFDVANEQGLVPGRQQVAGDAPDEHDVHRPVADDLVGDRDVAAPRV